MLQDDIIAGKKLSFNQIGAVPNTQGAKEQYLLNESIFSAQEDVKVIWLDIKKAYDHVNL